MNFEKRHLLQQKLDSFLSMPPEEKNAIDENPEYDGLFNTIQEMSDVVESKSSGFYSIATQKRTYETNKIIFKMDKYILNVDNSNINIRMELLYFQTVQVNDLEYSWAA